MITAVSPSKSLMTPTLKHRQLMFSAISTPTELECTRRSVQENTISVAVYDPDRAFRSPEFYTPDNLISSIQYLREHKPDQYFRDLADFDPDTSTTPGHKELLTVIRDEAQRLLEAQP